MEINHQLQLVKDDPYLEPFQVLLSPLRNTFMKFVSLLINGYPNFKVTTASTKSLRVTKDTVFTKKETSSSTGNGLPRLKAYPFLGISTTGKEENMYVRKYPFFDIE